MGPLTTLLLLLVLTGCTYTSSQLDVTLQDTMISSGEQTQLKVTVKNNENTTFNGKLISHSESESVQIIYPDKDNLDVTLYPDEEITRIFTVNAESNTRRTDYELTIQLHNQTQQIENKTNVLSVIR